MTRNRIGGMLHYEHLANLHRPADPERLRAEVRRLAADGLRPADISVALRLPLDSVRNLLAEATR
ncbi:MAG: hypothetical protein JJT85_11100 [Chromatiales bacterium]|nr:hypothetical protein [Chromatiales bacterium]